MSSDNAQAAVTYTSISSDSDGPSWGIPLMNVGEFLEIDPYEDVSKQGQVEGDDEDPEENLEEDPSEEHDPEDDDEDPEEDPNKEHEPKGSDETEPFEEDEIAALIDVFSAGSSLIPLPPINLAYDQAPLGQRSAIIRIRDDILEEDMPPQRRYVFTAPSPGCDVAESSAVTARAPRIQYDFVDTASERRMMTSIKEVNLRVSYQVQVRRQERRCKPNLGEGLRRPVQPAHVYSYIDFMKCQPLNFKGTEGVVGLSQWLEKMEVKGNDVVAYTQRFQELALMCTKFLVDKTEKVDKYISGLPDNIHGNVMSARLKTLDETIELANDLMDQKLRTYAERQNENKRKVDDTSRNNQHQPHKKQNIARAYTAGPGEKKVYIRDLPLCTKYNYHHIGQCAPKWGKCKRYGHTTTDCQVNTNNNNNNKNQKVRACYECGNTGHIKKNCLKLKNRGNGRGNDVAQRRSYALGGRDAIPDSNVITGTFLLNNRYAKIMFDTGADRSFISTTFKTLIDITSLH
nr:hypothetical protein [Tanacetum cinerariifolium]